MIVADDQVQSRDMSGHPYQLGLLCFSATCSSGAQAPRVNEYVTAKLLALGP